MTYAEFWGLTVLTNAVLSGLCVHTYANFWALGVGTYADLLGLCVLTYKDLEY